MTQDLPPNWRSAKDSDGKEYYFNELTGETSWTFPQPDGGGKPPPVEAVQSPPVVMQEPMTADASEFDTSGEPAAEYPALALWAEPPAAAPAGAAARQDQRATYLMVPLNELVDEHYSVYMCRLAARVARPPPYCLD